MNTLTLIMAIYNAGNYLTQTLASIEPLVSDSRIEVILINDGSTDNSESIIEHWCEGHERVLRRTIKNQGVSAARNIGLGLAGGDYIWFVDADDRIHSDAALSLLNDVNENSTDMVWASYNIVGEAIQNHLGGVKYLIIILNQYILQMNISLAFSKVKECCGAIGFDARS